MQSCSHSSFAALHLNRHFTWLLHRDEIKSRFPMLSSGCCVPVELAPGFEWRNVGSGQRTRRRQEIEENYTSNDRVRKCRHSSDGSDEQHNELAIESEEGVAGLHELDKCRHRGQCHIAHYPQRGEHLVSGNLRHVGFCSRRHCIVGKGKGRTYAGFEWNFATRGKSNVDAEAWC